MQSIDIALQLLMVIIEMTCRVRKFGKFIFDLFCPRLLSMSIDAYTCQFSKLATSAISYYWTCSFKFAQKWFHSTSILEGGSFNSCRAATSVTIVETIRMLFLVPSGFQNINLYQNKVKFYTIKGFHDSQGLVDGLRVDSLYFRHLTRADPSKM